MSAGFLAQVNELRRRYDLPPLCCPVTEFAGQMPLYIVPSTREYDYDRRDLPPSVQYVGPCLWDKPVAAPAPDWLLKLSRDRPLIYVTEATIGTREPFLLKTAVRAFRDLRAHVVMTTGAQRDAAAMDFGASPPNVRVESYVPQSDLLPRTAVMVTLGGSGGVLAALKAGVPLVVVPTEWDRPENAQRVVEAGAGIRIPPNRCTPDRLRAAVETILRERSFRMNAQRLAAACARYGGPERASELLESLCTKACCHAAGQRG
jgi:MGT family glycosyltransferase